MIESSMEKIDHFRMQRGTSGAGSSSMIVEEGPRERGESVSPDAKGRGERWSDDEQLIFIGSLFIVFATKGSMFPDRRSRDGRFTPQGRSDTIERVLQMMLRFEDRIGASYPGGFPRRTTAAVGRRFKYVKDVYIHRGADGNQGLGLKPLVDSWMARFGREMLGFPNRIRFQPRHHLSPWTLTEEIMLVGAVMTRFITYGSTCSLREGEPCWGQIAGFYRAQFEEFQLEMPRDVSPRQLHEHYKKLKRKNRPREGSNGLIPYVQAFYNFEGCRIVGEQFLSAVFLQQHPGV